MKHIHHYIMNYVCMGALMLLLSGCNPFRYMAPDSSDIQTRQMARHGELPPPYPLYCYNTLAEKVCYEKPLTKNDARLSGYYGPPPRQYDD